MDPERKRPQRVLPFTLVELMVGTVIAALVMLAAGFSVAFIFREAVNERARISVQRRAQLAAYWLDLSIRGGSWAYLVDGDSEDEKLVIDNFSDSSQRTIELINGDLLIDINGTEQTLITDVSSLAFEVYAGRVAYEFEVAAHGQTYLMSSARRPMSAPYRGVWRFAEGNGEVTYDDSGRQNHCAVHGATWTSGTNGAALSFNGTDAYLRIPGNDDLQVGGRIALGADVRPNSLPSGVEWTLFNLNGQDESAGFVHFFVTDSGKLGCAFATGAGTVIRTSTGGVTEDQWQNIYIQIDNGTGTVRFYVDGQKIDQKPYSGAMKDVTGGDGWIGALQGTTRFFEGELDEVRLLSSF